MDSTFNLLTRKYKEVSLLVFRNVFVLINVIVFFVVGLLIYVGNTKEGMFLGIIVILNVIIGIFQDLRAWLVLERLNLLTALSVTRIGDDGLESDVLPEEIVKGDKIKLKSGDQIPRDGILLSSLGLEINNALITGESTSFLMKGGNQILAGSIITAGSAVMEASAAYGDSRIAQMTVKIKKYSKNDSPIQGSINTIVTYSGYVLIAVILFVIARGALQQESSITIIQQVGALASTLVPQGLVIATTLLFAYGATHLFNRHVLLQEMNAVEKLGHIKNLCMDKTGTLTENMPTVEAMLIPPEGNKEQAERLASLYVDLIGDSSQTIEAIKKFTPKTLTSKTPKETLLFSSWRGFGGLLLEEGERGALFLGAPEIFAQQIVSEKEKVWLQSVVTEQTAKGRRVISLMQSNQQESAIQLVGSKLSVVAVFVLENNLREGIPEAIAYFQNRGVRIRVISGDNLETVRSVVRSAGILKPELAISGDELQLLNSDEFNEKVKLYTIFARIKPEQKERIIDALKKDGFTAMVGDGANDALAIKTADLGIAMFDGAKATRQLAGVVLTHNSFVELPGGVKLADSIIENIEIYASLFFNQTFLGFFFFVLLSILGYSFPFTPLNITFINYFTVGIPSLLIFYWTIRPREETSPINKQSFIKRVLPFPLISAIPQSIGAVAIVMFSVMYLKEYNNLNSISALVFISFGYLFFMFAPSFYAKSLPKNRLLQLLLLAGAEAVILLIALNISFVNEFFNISAPALIFLAFLLPLILVYSLLQYGILRRMAPMVSGTTVKVT